MPPTSNQPRHPRPAPAPPADLPGWTPWWRNPVLAALCLGGLVLLLYWPSYRAGTIWDDETMAANTLVTNGWHGLHDIWLSRKFLDYVPLTSTTFWLEWQLWGEAQKTQHAVNILLHAGNAILLWRVLRRLRIPGAFWAALLFAVHPVCVLSVTWLAERKNTLSMFFYLLSLLWYLRFDELSTPHSELRTPHLAPRPRSPSSFILHPSSFYVLSFLVFLLALLSKTSVVVLPAVLLLCLWWRHGRVQGRDLRRLVPFGALAAVFCLVTLSVHHHQGGRPMVLVPDSLLVRSLGAARAVWFYLANDLFPVNLTMHYPRWEIDPTSIVAWLPILGLLCLFILLWCCRRTWGRPCLAGIGYYVLALSPVLGIVSMLYLYFSRVADHFQYLALPGLIALIVGSLTVVSQRVFHRWPSVFSLQPLAVSLLIPLSILCWRFQTVVAHPERLWLDNLAKYPASWVAHNSLSEIYIEQGRFKEGEQQCRAALALEPRLAEPHYNLGEAFRRQQRWDDALREFDEAARLSPYDFKSRNNLGGLLRNLGRLDEALPPLRDAVRLDPDGIEEHRNLAEVLALKNQPREAIEQYRILLRLRPADARAQHGLARLLAAEGQFDEALAHYREVLRLQPRSAEACFETGSLLSQQHQTAQAIKHWRAGLALAPDSPSILNNLAWTLATSADPALRNGPEAVRFAERACAAPDNKSASFLSTLAAAYAETGRFADAIKAQQQAIDLAGRTGDKQGVEKLQQRLRVYQSHQPFHEP